MLDIIHQLKPKYTLIPFMKKILTIIFIFLSGLHFAKGQNTSVSNSFFGLNPILYNGEYYTYSPPSNTRGNQFLKKTQFSIGSVTIRNKVYDSLLLNYDVYNQELILKFKTLNGNSLLISLSKAWLSSFSIDDKNFEIRKFNGNNNEIFQLLGNNKYHILYHWTKTFAFNSTPGKSFYLFSKAIKQPYLEKDNKLFAFKNNKQFIRLFPKHFQRKIHSFLKNKQINVKKAGDNQMKQLITFCNNLTIK